MSRTSNQALMLAAWVFLGHLPMAATWIVLGSKYGQGLLCSMLPKADGFAQVSAGFSFSMMGFMAAVMALFSVLGQSRALKKYRQSGFLSVLLTVIGITILELAVSFVASLRLFADPVTPAKLMCAAVALAGGFGMVLISTLPIVGLQVRAANEKG